MKYEIRSKKKTTGVILNSIQNLINYWIPNQVRDDKNHISYSLFHPQSESRTSFSKLLKGAL